MDLPITLIIKAPNQMVDDHAVDCMLGWTVKMLKQHLTDVYPSKPKEKSQRLIYSGKLLADHLTLKEVLRQFEDGSNKHTVHLVCSSSPTSESRAQKLFNKKSGNMSRQDSSSSTQSQQSNNSDPHTQTDGLRHRIQHPAQTVPTSTNTFNNFNMAGMGGMPQMPAGMAGGMPAGMAGGMAGMPPEMAMMYPGMSPAAPGIGYSPEQYMWMQQMYSQYMAQYMQYYQQAAGYTVPPSPTGLPNMPQEVPQHPDNPAAADDVAEANNNRGEEEFHQRDWLDYVYTFSRFMVLLGIVYFYSSLTRFLMVGVFFLVVYAYQMGWFMLRNNNNRQQPPQEQQPQQEQPQNPQGENIQGDNPDGTNPEATVPESPPLPREPGVLKITWTFISTFFTSLFPSPPPAVNVN